MDPSGQIVAALGTLSVPILADAIGPEARLSVAVKPIWPGARVAGPVFTVEGGAPGDNRALHRGLYHAPAGTVLVASVGGACEHGYWGELMSTAAQHRGIAGVVLDGTARDPAEIEAVGFPVFAAGIHPRKSTKQAAGRLNVPITCAGLAVTPDDFVVGDEHGILVLASHELEDVLVRAKQLKAREEQIMERVLAGEALADVLGLDVS